MYSGYGKAAIRSTNVTIGLASLIVRLAFYAALPVRPLHGSLKLYRDMVQQGRLLGCCGCRAVLATPCLLPHQRMAWRF